MIYTLNERITTLRSTTEWLPVVNIILSIQTVFSLEYEAGNSVCTKKNFTLWNSN